MAALCVGVYTIDSFSDLRLARPQGREEGLETRLHYYIAMLS